MKTADQVAIDIERWKSEGLSPSDAAWNAAMDCLEWAYVFGAYGEYCDPSNRRSRYSADHPKIKEKCKNFNGRDDVPAGCVGCKWFLGNAQSDEKIHEGRTRFFDCRGYVYWILHKVCGMWDKCPAGATTMWKTASNWKDKGTVKKGVPDDVLVCLFVESSKEPGKMEHIGFGYHGETLECSSGVQYNKKRQSKWTHWAIPVCVDGSVDPTRPTLRRGDKGEYVTLAQNDLLKLGFKLPKYGADGSFGQETEAAVKEMQRANGLVEDGIIGQSSWKVLETAEKQPEPTTLYTVTVPHLTKYQAEGLVNSYAGAYMTEERG